MASEDIFGAVVIQMRERMRHQREERRARKLMNQREVSVNRPVFCADAIKRYTGNLGVVFKYRSLNGGEDRD